ncbi:MAG: hypothetical protein ABEJ93_00820 [Candidatus Nanohalobium sp.]
MIPVETFFGFGGALAFAVCLYYSRETMKHFREHREVSMTKFFIDKRGIKSFKLLSGSTLLYSVAMVATGLEFIYGSTPLLYASRGLLLVVCVLLVVFLREIFLLTQKGSEMKD